MGPRWPEKPKEFQKRLDQLYYVVDELSRQLMAAIAFGCGVEVTFFDKNARERSPQYAGFSLSGGSGEFIGYGVVTHRDSGLLTILIGVTTSGLYVLDDKTKVYVPVRPTIDQVFVMGGELLNFITGGRLIAPIHHVQTVPGPALGRISIANFLVGNNRIKIRRMFTRPDDPYLADNGAYADMASVEFVEARLAQYDYATQYVDRLAQAKARHVYVSVASPLKRPRAFADLVMRGIVTQLEPDVTDWIPIS